jgi:hypothetical protein
MGTFEEEVRDAQTDAGNDKVKKGASEWAVLLNWERMAAESNILWKRFRRAKVDLAPMG